MNRTHGPNAWTGTRINDSLYLNDSQQRLVILHMTATANLTGNRSNAGVEPAIVSDAGLQSTTRSATAAALWPTRLLTLVCLIGLPASIPELNAAELSADTQTQAQAIARASLNPDAKVTALEPAFDSDTMQISTGADHVASHRVNQTGSTKTQATESASPLTPLETPLTGIHTLLVEERTRKGKTAGSQPEAADIFYYDYDSQQSLYRQVDLISGDVITAKTLTTHHLPLSAIEQSAVVTTVRNHSAVYSAIQTELKQLPIRATQTGNTENAQLQGAYSLDYKVSIYEPDSPLQALATEDIRYRCQHARCALVTLTTDHFFTLSIQPIVFPGTGEIALLSNGNAR